MTTASALPLEDRVASPSAPVSVQWLLPVLTILLAGLAVVQLVYFVPRGMLLAQRFAGLQPEYIKLLLAVPEWLAVVVAVALGAVAFWQRRSVRRSALLAAVALAINVALVICIMGCLSEVLARVQPVAADGTSIVKSRHS